MVSRSKDDLKRLLKDHINFLIDSTEAYDAGATGEAQRLAVVIRVIVDGFGQEGSQSLLDRVGLKEMFFFDYSPDYNPKLGLPFSGIAVVTIGKSTPRYVPRLGESPRIGFKKVSFSEWWNKPVIVDESKKIYLTREGIIFSVANIYSNAINKDLNEAYNKLLSENPIGWVTEKIELDEDLTPIEFSSVRHIAFELLESLAEQAQEYFQ